MVREVEAVLCKDTRGIFTRGKVKIKECGDNDVEINIHWAGICHSDYHNAKGEWPGNKVYPMVPGHEIAGVVAKTGKNVTKFKVGQKVGVGCFVMSCRNCEMCKKDCENYCLNGMTLTYNSYLNEEKQKELNMPTNTTYGGYSQTVVVNEDYVISIPDAIPFEFAAPLLCAGITLYSPLVYYGAKAAGSKFNVAIVGLGGLGDMGVKLAKAMGCKVAVVSTSERKREYAEKTLGVEFVWTGRTEESISKAASDNQGRFDLLLNTASSMKSIAPYLQMVKTDGTLCMLGIPTTNLSFHAFGIVGQRKKLAGSCIGGIKETQECLDFCAEKGIWSEVEKISATEVNRAYKELGTYTSSKQRFVIDVKNTLVAEGSWQVDQSDVPKMAPHMVCKTGKIYGCEDTAGKTYKPDVDKFE